MKITTTRPDPTYTIELDHSEAAKLRDTLYDCTPDYGGDDAVISPLYTQLTDALRGQ